MAGWASSIVQGIPSYVIKTAREITVSDFRLANPNQRYRSSDAGIAGDEKLPFRQLQWATRSASHIIICYHRGGMGQAVCVLAFQLEPAQRLANPRSCCYPYFHERAICFPCRYSPCVRSRKASAVSTHIPRFLDLTMRCSQPPAGLKFSFLMTSTLQSTAALGLAGGA